ncbi:response regulator [Sulfurivirga sp.]|uniref:response regulator n=1 Tax=Sulfurivirga sp. TaxID=2614236 RepID=UPI0025E7E9DF|nr:response regulator [Sulfurivirga sp.]
MAKKVVLVDDSKTVLMTAELALKPLVDAGHIEIITYEDPTVALEAIKNGLAFDLLLTDINMPQMNGLDFARQVKAMPEMRLKPILAFTTENAPEMVQQGKQIGLAGWVVKPFAPEKLQMAIKRVLRIR